KLSVAGNIAVDGTITASGFTATSSISAPYFTATGAAATSTFAGGLAVETSGLVYDYSSGNVGIGTAAPNTPLTIDAGAIEKFIQFKRSDASTLWNIGSDSGGTLFGFGIYAGDTQLLDISTDGGVALGSYAGVNEATANGIIISGNVGIGTTTPWGKLSVNSDEIGIAPQFVIGSSTKTDFIVTNAGRVGIGTASPGEKLSVNGMIFINGAPTYNFTEEGLYLGYIGGESAINAYRAGGASFDEMNISARDIEFFTGSGATKEIIFDSNGNLGIGTTSPWGKLSVEMDTTNPSLVISNEGSSTPALFVGGVNQNGNVGIGTVAPAAKLEIGSGQIFVPLGSHSAPSYSFSGDGDTGMMSPGADSIRFSAGGYESLDINSTRIRTQAIWLNAAQEYGKLSAPSANTIQIGIDASDVSASTFTIQPAQSTGNVAGASISLQSGKGSGTTYGKALINPNGGYVGIGTTTPFAKLSVEQNAGEIGFSIGSSTATNFIVDENGYVGIGTASPSQLLHIDGTLLVGPGTGAGRLMIGDANTYIQESSGLILESGSTRTMRFSVNAGTEAMRILTTGNVGIGTTSPNNKLDIYSTTKSAIGFSGADGGTYKWTMGMDVTNGGRFSIASSTALGTTDRFVINGAGNVGIGTAVPNTLLHLSSAAPVQNMTWTNTANYGQLLFYENSTAVGGIQALGSTFATTNRRGLLELTTSAGGAGIAFRTGTTPAEVVRIDNSGNVGIGTTSPWAKLSVKGFVQGSGANADFQVTDSSDVPIFTVNDLGNLVFSSSSNNNKMSSFDSQGSISLRDSAVGRMILDNAYGYEFDIGGADKVRIDSSGNVGIGTTSPNQKLSIFKSAADSAIEFSSASGPNYKWTMGLDYTDGSFRIASSTALGSSDRFVINGAGNVGLGTSNPQARLHAVGQNGVSAYSLTYNPTSTGRTGTIQTWTVPETGTYTIEADGAQGGGIDPYIGGLGAKMVGTFSLNAGDQIKILVGQAGSTYTGGGGGTFVTRDDNTPLIIAGGGGGASSNFNGINATTTTSGEAAGSGGGARNGGPGSGGGGAGGGTAGSGAGGAGYCGNGGDARTGVYDGAGGAGGSGCVNGGDASGTGALTVGSGGDSFLNGGFGGVGGGNGGEGGFGGGGGAIAWNRPGGGGGGYSGGGGGGQSTNHAPGGGGGSYNAGTNQSNTAGARSGAGIVIITRAQASQINAAYFDGGNVGIGTSSPWGKLSAEMDTTNPSLVISNEGSSTPAFYVGGVNQNGNIGIGTANPTNSKLVIDGDGSGNYQGIANYEMSLEGDLYVTGTIYGLGTTLGNIFMDSGDGTYYLDPANSGISMKVAGKVGIGAAALTPTHLIELDSDTFGTTTGWQDSSDRNRKENFLALGDISLEPIKLSVWTGNGSTIDAVEYDNGDEVDLDNNELLKRLSMMPVMQWNFINDDDINEMSSSTIKHIGPTAQDFYKLFGLGSADTRVKATDLAGVSLAGLKALNEKVSPIINNIKVDEGGNIKIGPSAGSPQLGSGQAGQGGEPVVEIVTATTTIQTAFVVNQSGSGDIADFKAQEVSVMNIASRGKVSVVGTLAVDGRIMACAGSACGAALDEAVDETAGDIGVEGKVVAGAFEGYCEDGFIWVPGSAKYGTMPGFCVAQTLTPDPSPAPDGAGEGSPTPWVNVSQGEAQLACQSLGTGYHLISENEWLTMAGDIIKVGANDIDEVTPGLQLATTTPTPNPSPAPDVVGEGNRVGFTLTNGNVVYELAGEVGEWTDRIISTSAVPTPESDTWQEYYEIDIKDFDFAPPYYLTAANGIGKILVGAPKNRTSSLAGFVRGQGGIYGLNLTNPPIAVSEMIGFRCAR
ncbi:MAG: hypothetical protein WC619_04750, partial [Patescibacteria group bacterium]